jgi:heme-degrading monooxygenase HmoA
VIYELVEAEIKPGAEAAFEAAYAQATTLLQRTPGCHSVRMLRGVEEPSKFRILIQWESLEHHTQGFRGSPDHQQLISLTRPHYLYPSLVQHYTVVIDTEQRAQ